MRITQEADYALRISTALSGADRPIGAPQLSNDLRIPQRFTSKILRKLLLAGLVLSTRGANGGFTLAENADNITLLQIIEAVDGETAIRHCLTEEHVCDFQPNKACCKYHRVFEELNRIITSRLNRLTIADMTNPQISACELTKRLYQF